VPTFIFEFQAMSLALLVATLFVLGKAAQDSEITALLAGGVSLGRIARVPVFIALILSLGIFVYENTVGIENSKMGNRIHQEYFRRALDDTNQGPSWTQLGAANWSCHILHFNHTALTGTDVFIHAFDAQGMQEIRAERIYWEPATKQWILEDGRWATIRRNPDRKDARRITQEPAPFSETPDMLFALKQPPSTKTVGALYRDLKNAEAMGVPTTRARVAFHTKFSRPALCFIIVWLAIPFALRVRGGGLFLSFGLSIALGLAYVTLYAIAIGLGNIGLLPPVVAAWLANVVFLGMGVLFFHKMRT
ncbi:MAG: LptF/LptG family permease, partial [Candidatus Hydrogenedentes bacterium]|nr:LptF/LptG family permease [Candidatus Hydrogenedentota bacterium]